MIIQQHNEGHCASPDRERGSERKIASEMMPSDASAVLVRRYCGEYGAHAHGHAQVLVGLEGNLQLEVDGRGAFVDPSCGLVVPAGAAHGYLAPHPATVLVLDCDEEGGLDRLRRFAVPVAWRKAGVLPMRAADLLSGLSDTRTLQTRRRLDLARLQDRVDAELHRAWTTAELADACGFSAQRLRARFVDLLGIPPLAWLRERRLLEAQRLLRAGLSLEAAALQVGYSSASALGFALRRDHGVGARGVRKGGRQSR